MINDNLICMRAFRHQNGITQKNVADYLGVTVGFISLVEKSKSRLPSKHIDLLFAAYKKKGWKPNELVPAYSRLVIVNSYINYPSDNHDPWEDESLIFDTFQPLGIDRDTINRVRHGDIGITEPIANMICKNYPEVNSEWLVTGKGPITLPIQNPQEDKRRAKVQDIIWENSRKLLINDDTIIEQISSLPDRINVTITENTEKIIEAIVNNNCMNMFETIICKLDDIQKRLDRIERVSNQ
mgnify:CR=1 FL=1